MMTEEEIIGLRDGLIDLDKAGVGSLKEEICLLNYVLGDEKYTGK